MTKIALDLAGGDLPALARICGLMEALQETQHIEVFLVGDASIASLELSKARFNEMHRIHLVHTKETIAMGETPSSILKEKKNSSLALAVGLVQQGKADAVVSAGNTGAQMAASLFQLGRIAQIDRPAIAITVPCINGSFVLLDAGANTDIKAKHLEDFALMGIAYAKILYHIVSPRLGILNNGTESEKGNKITKEAYSLLSSCQDFYGFVEGREMMQGVCDVIVCDGFTGNIVLKTIEGVAQSLLGWLKEECSRHLFNQLAALILKKSFRILKAKLDYRVYGGAPLLGVNGISIICHGSSDAFAIKNALLLAHRLHEQDLVKKLQQI